MNLPSINPVTTEAWKKLEQHFLEVKKLHMMDLFAQDKGRSNKMKISWNDFQVDFSKNRITDETLSYDVIETVVHGEGHYLRHQQTMDLMRSEYEYPKLADRSAPNDWEDAGSPDIRERAADTVRQVLSSHYPEYIDPLIDQQIRDRFPILLGLRDMRAGNARWQLNSGS